MFSYSVQNVQSKIKATVLFQNAYAKQYQINTRVDFKNGTIVTKTQITYKLGTKVQYGIENSESSELSYGVIENYVLFLLLKLSYYKLLKKSEAAG